MDKRFITSISFIVIQACFIISVLYVYVIPFGSMLWRSLNGSDQVTVAKIASSILPLKKSLMHKEIEYSASNSFNSNTPSAFVQPEYRDNFKRYLICQIPKTRLGNHMFSFATSFGIAHALNYTFVMRSSSPLLKYFELNQTLVKRIENAQKITIIQWKQNTWNKTNQPGNLTLEGYWREWNYFASISGNIRKSFTFKSNFLNVAKRFIRSHNPSNRTLIGVHVRRGDFLRQKALKKGRVVVNKDYLLKAMNWFRHQHKDACFIVVSDDKMWCRDNIPGEDVIFSNYTEPMHDMAILSLCNHVVISTGTFGWWGAWLAGGTVVYCSDYHRPGSYLANHTLFREDYYPPSWIGMSNGI